MQSRRARIFHGIFGVLFCSLFVATPSANASGLALPPQLTQELDALLRAGDSLRGALFHRNEEQADLTLRETLWQLERARSASLMAKLHERNHLLRLINATRSQLELSQTTYGKERKVRLSNAFNHMANLARIYKVDRSFRIYFCAKDKTTWIQRGDKAQSPFRNDSCGVRVSR